MVSTGHSDIFQVPSVPRLDGWNRMRFQRFKTSPQRNILITDAQAKVLFFPNINILSLPGGQIRHWSLFSSKRQLQYIYFLFTGGNDLFDSEQLTVKEPINFAEWLRRLAYELVLVAEEAFDEKLKYNRWAHVLGNRRTKDQKHSQWNVKQAHIIQLKIRPSLGAYVVKRLCIRHRNVEK